MIDITVAREKAMGDCARVFLSLEGRKKKLRVSNVRLASELGCSRQRITEMAQMKRMNMSTFSVYECARVLGYTISVQFAPLEGTQHKPPTYTIQLPECLTDADTAYAEAIVNLTDDFLKMKSRRVDMKVGTSALADHIGIARQRVKERENLKSFAMHFLDFATHVACLGGAVNVIRGLPVYESQTSCRSHKVIIDHLGAVASATTTAFKAGDQTGAS